MCIWHGHGHARMSWMLLDGVECRMQCIHGGERWMDGWMNDHRMGQEICQDMRMAAHKTGIFSVGILH